MFAHQAIQRRARQAQHARPVRESERLDARRVLVTAGEAAGLAGAQDGGPEGEEFRSGQAVAQRRAAAQHDEQRRLGVPFPVQRTAQDLAGFEHADQLERAEFAKQFALAQRLKILALH